MSDLVEQSFEPPAAKYLVDSYENWARAEGVPIHAGPSIDLLVADTRPWGRFGVKGALCHLDGRCDFLTLFLFDIAPGAASTPIRHLYEEIYYVLAGRGVTEIEFGDGRSRAIEWGSGSLFSAPMNARVRHRNTSSEPARLAAVNDFRYLLNLYRNETFIFETPLDFPDRDGGVDIIRDLATASLGATTKYNEAIAPLVLAKSSIGVELVEIPAGAYGRAERQMQGALLLGIAGDGMSIAFTEGSENIARCQWRHGVAYAPPGMAFNQHFNIGTTPLRFLSIELGSGVSPMFRPRRRAYGDTDVYASGAAEISFADQDKRIDRLWRDTLVARAFSDPIGSERRV